MPSIHKSRNDKPRSRRCKSKEHRKSREHRKSKEHKKSREHRKSKEHKKSREHRKSREHSDSDSDDEREDKFDELYNEMRRMLVADNQLMANGSQVYFNAYSTVPRVLQENAGMTYDNVNIKNKVKFPFSSCPLFVEEDGYYVIFFFADTVQSNQFTFFINGVSIETTTMGNNAGGGQSIRLWMLPMKKNDGVAVRNYKSNSGSLTVNSEIGGTQDNINLAFLVHKVAPLEMYEIDRNCELNHKHKHLFNKLEQKMLMDPCLQLKGFNAHGAFTNFTNQTVALEAPVIFTSGNNVNGITPMDGAGSYSNIRIDMDGLYEISFLCTTDVSAQFAIFVNGVAEPSSISGSNKGAGQITARTILNLKKDDIISVNNHSSSGNVTLSQDAGGILPGISAILTIYKISPAKQCDQTKNEYKKCEEHLECMYRKFKNYLLMNKHLQLNGSSAFLNASTRSPQTLQIGDKLIFTINLQHRNMKFIPGTSEIHVEENGDYIVYSDIITDRPSQFTLFVNNNAVTNTTTGRDSGSNRNSLRQIVSLKKGDILDVRNWKSSLGQVTITSTTGGTFVDTTGSILIFKLSNPCDLYHQFNNHVKK